MTTRLYVNLARRRRVLASIEDELIRAYEKHGSDRWGRHEFYAILLEEVDELFDAIKGDEPPERVALEAVQVAAMVVRYLETGDRYSGRSVFEEEERSGRKHAAWCYLRPDHEGSCEGDQ